MRNLVLEI